MRLENLRLASPALRAANDNATPIVRGVGAGDQVVTSGAILLSGML